MRELLFNISGQKLEKNENCNFDDIVMNSNNYLKLLFYFDASWKGSRARDIGGRLVYVPNLKNW